MKRSKTTGFGIACGALCAVCVLGYTYSVRGEADAVRAEALERYGGEQIKVCVAKQDIAAGETVTSTMFEERLWVADLLPEQAVREGAVVEGKKASSTVLAGEVLSERRFREEAGSLDVPAGTTAVSVPVKDVQAVGGAVSLGSLVDIYATGSSTTTRIASEVLVLDTSSKSQDGAARTEVAWVTVALNPELVQEVVSAAQKTELYLALPSSTSSDVLSKQEDDKAVRISVSSREGGVALCGQV